jgi:hypothetical protein
LLGDIEMRSHVPDATETQSRHHCQHVITTGTMLQGVFGT